MSHELRTENRKHELNSKTRVCPGGADLLLEPLFDGVQRVDGDGVDHRHLLAVVLVNDDHVEVLQVELHALEVDQLHLVQGHHKRRLDGEGRGEAAFSALATSGGPGSDLQGHSPTR